MEYTFPNSNVILGIMTSAVIFWTVFSCWRKSYSNNNTLFLGWSHRYKNYNGHYLNMVDRNKISIYQMTLDFIIFSVDVFFPLSLPIRYTLVTMRCLMKSRKWLPFASNWVHPQLFGGIRVTAIFIFLCCPIMCLYVQSSVLWWPLRCP